MGIKKQKNGDKETPKNANKIFKNLHLFNFKIIEIFSHMKEKEKYTLLHF